MLTLKQLLASHGPAANSPAELAARRGIASSYSIRELDARSFPLALHPEDAPIGCTCTLTFFGHGAWSLDGHIRNSSDIASYEFDLRVLALGTNVAFAIPCTGKVGPAESKPISLSGTDHRIRTFWSDVQSAKVHARLTTELGGFFGDLVGMLKNLVEYLLLVQFLGGPISAVIVLGRDIAAEADLPRILPSWPRGILAVGGVLIFCGPLGAFPLAVAGFAVNALEGFDMRELDEPETALAREVFGNSLNLDRIRITNAGDEQASCVPMPDGFSLIHVGTRRYPSMMTTAATRTTFVHELVHCWQHLHTLQAPWDIEESWEQILQNIVKDDSKYELSPSELAGTRPWTEIHFEAQGSLIGHWYAKWTSDADPIPNTPNAMTDPIYGYLERDIRPARP